MQWMPSITTVVWYLSKLVAMETRLLMIAETNMHDEAFAILTKNMTADRSLVWNSIEPCLMNKTVIN